MSSKAISVTSLRRLASEGSSKVRYCVNDVAWLSHGLTGGDEEAFREFHQRYFNRLLRYLLVITRGNEEAAREVLQETYLRVARHARPFEKEEVFWSWVVVLARSSARDRGRKQQRYCRLLARYTHFWASLGSKGPRDTEIDRQTRALLNESLTDLSSLDRKLVEGKYFHGSSVMELANNERMTEKAVESRLVRARRQLRETLLKKLSNEL